MESLVIKKFHLNIWEINTKYIRLECGLHFKMKKTELLNHEELVFNLFTPFPVFKNSLAVVYQNLLNNSNINLIFNEHCLGTKDCTMESSFPYANLIRLGNDTKFLLIKPNIINSVNENSKIVFKIIQKHIILDDFKEDIEFYVRFYYRVDLKKCKIIITKPNLSTDFIIYDIRLRDLRLFNPDDLEDKYDKIIEVEDFYVFIINEVNFKPRLIDLASFRYRRILEKTLFKYYVEELRRTFKRYTIHYWKFDLKKKQQPANLVTSFEKEKSIRVLAAFALAMNIIVAILFTFSNNSFEMDDFNPVILIIIVILAVILISPTLFRRLYNNLWISKVNKNN